MGLTLSCALRRPRTSSCLALSVDRLPPMPRSVFSMANLDVMALAIAVPIEVERPLCVGLDGTLVKSDTLADSLMVLARRHPAALLRMPLWAMKGRAYLKSRVTGMVSLDVAHLPYNRPLLDYLREEYAAGRSLILATGADGVLA